MARYLTMDQWDKLGYRKCSRCYETRPITEFHLKMVTRKDTTFMNYRSECKTCWNKVGKASKYRIPPKRYFKMLADSNNICEICGVYMDKPCLDHNHDTGAIRGLLCNPCNTGLQLIERDYANAFRSIVYLEKYKDVELDKNSEWRRDEFNSVRCARYRNKIKNKVAKY